MSASNNAARVRRAIEAIWNRCQLEVADELFAPDYVNHDGLIPDLLHGPEAVKFSVVFYRRAFPELHISIEELRAEGEAVVLHWTAWRRSADSPGGGTLTADQRLLTGITRSRLAGGKVTESWTEWDGIPDLHLRVSSRPTRRRSLAGPAQHEGPSRAGPHSSDDGTS